MTEKEQINRWFSLYIMDYGRDDLVQACEDCAHHLEHDEWLDDSDHDVWEIGMIWFEKIWEDTHLEPWE